MRARYELLIRVRRDDFASASPAAAVHWVMSNERARAVEMARELVRTQRHSHESACEAALAATGVKLTRDQLKALAFGATFYGFGHVERVSV